MWPVPPGRSVDPVDVMASVVTLDNVAIRYGSSAGAVLSEVSFSLDSGEKWALLGINGTGKTALLKALCGLAAHQGSMVVLGKCPGTKGFEAVRKHMGVLLSVPSQQILMPSVRDEVRLGASLGEKAPKQNDVWVDEWLHRFHLARLADSPTYALSHGQTTCLALASLFVAQPCLLLLDEPSSGLDPQAAIDLADIIGNHEAAALIATHDWRFARRCCSKFLLLDQGRVQTPARSFDELPAPWREW